MGTAIVAKNSNAETSGIKKFIPPVTRNLEAWHFLNTDVAKAVTNYAIGKGDATVVGTPIEAPTYLRFKGLLNYIETTVMDTPTSTVFSVIRSKDLMTTNANSPAFYGTYPINGMGSMLYINPANGSLVKTASRYSDVEQAVITSAPISTPASAIVIGEWSLFVDITTTSVNRALAVTSGSDRSTTGTTYGRAVPPAVYRIGGSYSGSTQFEGTADIALWAHYSTVLTTSEINAVVERIRAYMLQRQGITV